MNSPDRNTQDIGAVLRTAVPPIRAQRRRITLAEAEEILRREAHRQGVPVAEELVRQAARGAHESSWRSFRRIVLRRQS